MIRLLADVVKNVVKSRIKPLDTFIYRVVFFLSPQMEYLKENYSEYDCVQVITLDSISYVIALAEQIGKRTILMEEYFSVSKVIFSRTLKDHFNNRKVIDEVSSLLGDPETEPERHRRICSFLKLQVEEKRSLAIEDVNSGKANNSNYLVKHAYEVVFDPKLRAAYNFRGDL